MANGLPDKNCELILQDDFYEIFSSGAAIVELYRIIQNSKKNGKNTKMGISGSSPPAIPKRRHSPNGPEVNVDYFLKSPEVTSDLVNDVIVPSYTFPTVSEPEVTTGNPKADITRRSIRHTQKPEIKKAEVEASSESSGESEIKLNIKRARGLKKNCIREEYRNYPVCRRYRLNLKKRVRRAATGSKTGSTTGSDIGSILDNMPDHRYQTKSYQNSKSKIAKINTEIIEKFAWIPDLLQKVIHNQTTPAVKNSMNTIAMQVLGVGSLYSC